MYPEHPLFPGTAEFGRIGRMSDRLIKLLAELEYLRTLGQCLIDECDKALEECNRLDGQELQKNALGSGPRLEN
jgi:hypothetical protein